MVIDTLDNLDKYVGLNPLFADVVEFLKQNDLNTLEAGKHPIGSQSGAIRAPGG